MLSAVTGSDYQATLMFRTRGDDGEEEGGGGALAVPSAPGEQEHEQEVQETLKRKKLERLQR